MRRLLRTLLRLYPGALRARYGQEIQEVVIARGRAIRARQGRLAAARYWRFQLRDLLGAALRERRAAGELPGAGLGQDGRLAVRRMRRYPGFTLVVVVALAIGIGGTTAIFALVDAVLIRPLPYPDQERLVYVGIATPRSSFGALPAGAVREMEEREGTFEAFGAWSPGEVAVQWPDGPRRHRVVGVTPGALPALGVVPALGRGFAARDMAPGAPLAVLLDHGFWEQDLGGAAGVIGQDLRVDGAEAMILGVLPAGFRFLDVEADLYLPLRLDDTLGLLSFDYYGLGRLPRGAGFEGTARQVTAALHSSAERYGWIDAARLREWELRGAVGPLKEIVVGNAGSLLWVLLGSVAVVLLIACADVANLYLIRAQSRRQEIAARIALGASRWRVLREALVESLLMALLAGVLGTVLGHAATQRLLAMAPGRLPRASDLALDPGVLLFALGLCVAVGIALPLVAGLGLGGDGLTSTLRHGERTASEPRLARRLRDALAASEIALALVLLVASGLMIRSFVGLRSVDPGIRDPDRVLTLSIAVPGAEVPDAGATVQLYRRILERLAALPGAGPVGAASRAAAQGGNSTPIHTEQDPEAKAPTGTVRKAILGDYLAASGIPLLAGRDLDWDDAIEGRAVGLVSENLARALWGDPAAALGKRIRHLPGDAWREVVGVVGDVHEAGLDRPAPPVVYWPAVVHDFYGFPELIQREVTFEIRSAGPDPSQLLAPAREAIRAEAPAIPIAATGTLDALLSASIGRTSFLLVAVGLAAGVATLLGGIGIYGVLAYVFARRGRELAIRVALGARAGDVGALVLRHAGGLAAAGLAVGVPAAALASRLLRGYLYGVGTVDAPTYLAAAGLVVTLAVMACVPPARRALALDPVQKLRAD